MGEGRKALVFYHRCDTILDGGKTSMENGNFSPIKNVQSQYIIYGLDLLGANTKIPSTPDYFGTHTEFIYF